MSYADYYTIAYLPKDGKSVHWMAWGARFDWKLEAERYVSLLEINYPELSFRIEGHTFTENDDE